MTKIMNKARVVIGLGMLLCLCALPASAQNARLQIDQFERLFPNAVETIDVTLEGSLLQIASKFLSDKPEEAAIKEIVSVLKGVYVKGVEFDQIGSISDTDIESIRTQLSAPGWQRIVGVRSKRDGENAEVYMMLEGGIISGIGVLVYDPKQLFVVNVVGPIDPEKIGQLRGHFGVPKDLDFDFGATRK